MKKINFLLMLIVVVGISLVIYTVSATTASTPSFEVSETPSGGPVITTDLNATPNQVGQNEDVSFSVGIGDVSGVASAVMQIKNSAGTLVGTTILYDNGIDGGDLTEADGIYSGIWNTGSKGGDIYSLSIKMKDRLGNYNVEASNTTVEITAPPAVGCSVNTDCGINTLDRCCGTTCAVDECVSDAECVSGTNGVCNITACPSVCEYSTTPASVPVITSALTANGVVGDPSFAYNIAATNSPTSYNATGLPAGLSIDATGLISGTPATGTEVGSPYSVTISATNATGTDTQILILTIVASADTTPPVVSILSPLDVAGDPTQPFTTDTIIVKALATDDIGISQVEFLVDGALKGTQQFETDPLKNPGEYWQTLIFTNGTHTITAVAYDNSQNITNSTVVNISFNLTSLAPVINSFLDVDVAGIQHIGDYNNTDVIQFKLDAIDNNGLITKAEIYKNGGSGFLTVDNPLTPSGSYLITFHIGASTITYLDQAILKYADESNSFKLPFIPVAKAAIIGNQNCTTTTTPRDRQIYAVVYDDSGLSTISGMASIRINTTSTSCVNIPASSGAAGGGV